MSQGAQRLRDILAEPGCTAVAPVFDSLSARIAQVLGWEVGKLPGSTGKFANLGLPDGVVLSSTTDLVDIARRLTNMADLSLIVDADDGGSPLQVRRTIRDLEAAGVAGIELDDMLSPSHFGRDPSLVSVGVQVAKLSAAASSRRDPSTLIIGRSSALQHLAPDEAVRRIEAYAQTGIDALMLPGLNNGGISSDPRRDIEAVQAVSGLPLFVSGLPAELLTDVGWLEKQRIKLLFHGPHPYKMAVRAIHDALDHLRRGGDPDELKRQHASGSVLDAVVDLGEFEAWDQKYSRIEEVQDQRTHSRTGARHEPEPS